MNWRIVWLVMWSVLYITDAVSTGVFVFFGFLPWIMVATATVIFLGGLYWCELANEWEAEKNGKDQP